MAMYDTGWGGGGRAGAYSGLPGWAQESDRPEYEKFRSETGGGNFYDFRNWKQSKIDEVKQQQAAQQRQTMLSDLMKTADPFAGQRQQYQTQLSQLMANPGEFMKTSPVFQATLDAGTEAVNRSAAAKGMLGSGNRLLALQEAGQKAATQSFFPMAELLGKFSAAGQNPEAASETALNLANLTERQREHDLANLPLPGSVRAPAISKTWNLSNFWTR